MATRSLWRTRGKLAVAATVASSEDPETALKLCTAVPVRPYLDTVTAQTHSIAFDGLVDEISESLPKASRVNIRMGIVEGVVGCPGCSSDYCISLMGKT
ncbi:hypothetical protein NC651_025247 [Populus alba x Populus x berolinensis]|nr:hypothetical protein NC651_025247 [Populus alba x Populus x berolinensis]